MLLQRIQILNQYVRDTQQGLVPKDETLLRSISTLCNRLPTVQSKEFKNEFDSDLNDVLLVACLATLTKSVECMSEVESF